MGTRRSQLFLSSLLIPIVGFFFISSLLTSIDLESDCPARHCPSYLLALSPEGSRSFRSVWPGVSGGAFSVPRRRVSEDDPTRSFLVVQFRFRFYRYPLFHRHEK